MTWVFSDQSQGEFEVIVPLEVTFRDYASRIAEVLKTLEAVEERSQLELLKDITTSSTDLVRIQPEIETWSDGSINIEQGNALVQQTRDLLLAAACATVRPAKLYPTRKPTQAMEYMRKARLGQTERGSFILTVHSPVTPHLQLPMMQAQLMPDIDIPFERRVMQTLFRALVAVKDAAIKGIATNSLEPFAEAVQRGVSANLCEALVALHVQTEAKSVSFKMTWARARESAPGIASSADIHRGFVPVIEEAGKWLKETSPQDNTEIEGMPVLMTSQDATQGGLIMVPTIVEGRLRKVRVHLEQGEYQKAVAAHLSKSFIRCEGTLSREGRSYVLSQPSPIEVEEPEFGQSI
jgi:hypothetical protein